jgi:uncharacterized membrane protein
LLGNFTTINFVQDGWFAAKQLLLMICGITLLLDARDIIVGVYNNYNENTIE